MEIFLIILTILASLGATIIITRSWLFENFRDFASKNEFFGVLFNCMVCTGWWMGLIFGLIVLHNWPISFLIPFITSLCGWLLEIIQN